MSFWRRKQMEISDETSPSTTVTQEFDAQRDSKFVNLPEDVHLAIIAFFDEGSIPSLIRTCKYLRHTLEPILYRHLILVGGERYLRSGLLHGTLSARPDLIPYIYTYHGPIIPPHYVNGSSRQAAIERAKNLRTRGRNLYDSARAARVVGIFLQAVNIRDLYFTDGHRWIDDPGRWDRLQDAVSNMSLDKLVLEIEGLPSYVAPVLRAQPNLTDLTIKHGSIRLGGLVESDIPKLVSLKSTLGHAALIVPGRPVENLHLICVTSEQSLDEYWVKQLALSTGPIRKFTMTLHSPSNDDLVRDTLRTIRSYLSSMEHLTLKVRGRISAAVLLEEIPAFQHLRTLHFLEACLLGSLVSTSTEQSTSSPSIAWPTPMDQSQRREVINSIVDINRQFRAACPGLVDVRWTAYDL
ncbi:hypothetical protein FRC01_010351 [Tulasnella sp. 417]|nr:hypothetical protein FRC01_010351 [Tulasnella sp. 417]